MLWCPILPERRAKFETIMRAMAAGWREGAKVVYGLPPRDNNPVVIYGQSWSEALMRDVVATQRPFWHIDNGYWRPGRGRPDGYYRICYRSMSPRFIRDADPGRARALGIEMKPWRKTGGHVVLALPGLDYGRGIGLNMLDWIVFAKNELPRYTDRLIVARPRIADVPLEHNLKNAWCLVTHSSNAAVDAVTAGIPVFVEPTASAAPVGNLSWNDLERPRMPDREQWFNSLACQQFSLAEMADGTAYDHLMAVKQLAA